MIRSKMKKMILRKTSPKNFGLVPIVKNKSLHIQNLNCWLRVRKKYQKSRGKMDSHPSQAMVSLAPISSNQIIIICLAHNTLSGFVITIWCWGSRVSVHAVIYI